MTISGATYREGVAYSPDGAMYVTLDPTGSYSGVNVSSTGQFRGADGTVGAPTYAWTNALSSGWYLGAANQPWLSANGLAIARAVNGSGFGVTSLFFEATVGGGVTNYVGAGANSLTFGASSATTTSRTEINKAVTTFTNAVAKTVFTVTIPNAAHNATIELRVMGTLGAGGAIGAGEAMATNTYVIGIVRTAGVATVATATAAFGAVAVAVAGAATVTATAAVTAMSGAVGATQTFDIQVTISRSGGSSDNHTCMAYAKLLNANATGITIA